MKECVRHTDDTLGDAWSCTSAFVCIGVFNWRLSVFNTCLLSVFYALCSSWVVGEESFPRGLRPKSVWNKCWKADWFWFARGRRGKAYFLVTARNRKYRVFLEDRERGKRCWCVDVMLKQAKVGSKKLRDLSCVDKPLPGGAQGCALLLLRWVLETRLCQGRGQGLEVGDKHVTEDLS